MVNLWDAVVSHDDDTPVHWKKNRNKQVKHLKKRKIFFIPFSYSIFISIFPIFYPYFSHFLYQFSSIPFNNNNR